jgi:hypothetical protein
VGLFHDPNICQLFYVGHLKRFGIHVYFSYIQVELKIWMQFCSRHYLQRFTVHPIIFIRNIVHPKNIHKRHCSFQDYSHKKLVIPRIFTETPHIPTLFPASIINSKVIIENANTIHNILTIWTGIIHYLYRHQFLPIFYVSSHECKIVEAHVRC